jgi:hypothetical protein
MAKTGDPEIDALFKAARKAKKAEKPAIATPEYKAVSEERVKPEGEIQNSGIIAGEGREVLVPHMSVEELETNTPARGKGMVPVTPPEGVSISAFLLLLSNAYALYVTKGSYDNDALQVRTGLAPGTIAKVLSSPEFKYALRLRGVFPNSTGLTREQDLVLLALTDPSDGKTLQQKLRACQVSFATYRAWMKQPVFKMQMDAMTESTLSDNSHALVQLDKLAGEGDLGAIKFKLELNGRYDPNKQQNIDVIAMMSMMLDIMARHVRDPETLAAISSDMGQLASQLKLTPQIGA